MFAKQENIDKELDKLKKINDCDMLTELNKVCNEIRINAKFIENCKSDASHWGYVAIHEELEAVKVYITQRIFNILRDEKTLFVTIEMGNVELSKVHQRAINTKKEINLYKPSNYKKMIEIITKVVGKE